MKQGDIFWYKFKEPNKQRPVLILSRTDVIPMLNSVTVVEITTTMRENDSEVWLDESDGMPKPCAVNLTNIQTVPKTKIGTMITALSPTRMRDVRCAIEFIFNLQSL